ncbi:GHKL domain-containing protein [Ligilactobacillus sp. WILCCON 0076]|uniref:GHKL domain-containing protein n=1 Tax=Ligilactobacillus ubinensis TaxID=2876789 RepID=A0A9X2FLZ5_9LACO|nr:GHKL domain-containing protein [Ligilactobacillus ubinensis]MCP0887151.1 GHKL domain-containing protein [Ligilactobacillus ubinensis]
MDTTLFIIAMAITELITFRMLSEIKLNWFYTMIFLVAVIALPMGIPDYGNTLVIGAIFIIVLLNDRKERQQSIAAYLFYSMYTKLSMMLFLEVVFYIEIELLGLTSWTNVNDWWGLGNTIVVLLMQIFVIKTVKTDLDFLRSEYKLQHSYVLFTLDGLMVAYLIWSLPIVKIPDKINDNIIFEFGLLAVFLSCWIYLHYNNILYKKRQIKEMEQRELANLVEYTQKIETLYSELRHFRHDYLNVLAGLDAALKNQSLSEVKQIYDDVLMSSKKEITKNKYSLGALSNLDDEALKGLVSSKLIPAVEAGVKIEVEVLDEIKNTTLTTLDLVRIVGVFLDNALEATLKTSEAWIKFSYFEVDTVQHLIVENSIAQTKISIDEIFEEGQTTKGDGHGMGLANVKNILAKYPQAHLVTDMNENKFRQDLILI